MTPRKPVRATPTARRASHTHPPQPIRDLLLRLDHLRASVREVARAYLANLEHDIVEIRAAVAGGVSDAGRKAKLRRNIMERMSDMLDDVALKPHKGRRGDLKKVERIVRSFQRLVAKHAMAEPRRHG